jgi:prepilin-type N-terminal cleavage/methylation domain-containing protein
MGVVRRWMKRGFTLVETVVTVGIVATLAAIIVPEVLKQAETSEPLRIQQDLKNLQTAISTFAVNVKAIPGDLDDLTNPLTSAAALPAADTAMTGTGGLSFFTTTQATLWNGPYIDAALVENATEVTRQTGNAALIYDDFVCYNSPQNDPNENGAAGDQDCPGVAAGEQIFLAIRITGLGANDDARFIEVNDLFDGTLETTAALRSNNGRIRHLTVGGVPTVYFLVLALN